jgi:hypothetical protein
VVCGAEAAPRAGGCTNSACADCHRRYCTEDGVTGPGHGLDVEAARAKEEAR